MPHVRCIRDWSARYILNANFPRTPAQWAHIDRLLNRHDGATVHDQSKYLMEAMSEVQERDGSFMHATINDWMTDPHNNTYPYTDMNLIDNSWRRAHNENEGAWVPNFTTFFTKLN